MTFTSQHTGNGRYHLIEEATQESKELCHTKGILLWSYVDIELKEGIFYELWETGRREIPKWMINAHFCKKCINIAIKKENEKRKSRR